MKTKRMTRLTIFMILISFIFTTVISVTSLNIVINENAEDMTTIITGRVYDTINSELLSPIMVARTMSCDGFLQKELLEEDSLPEEKVLADLTEYLEMIRSELGYHTAFVVSEKSKKYYTYKGLNKIVNPEEDEHDVWYSAFLEGGKDYDFDVDTDEVNENKWTIFVNSRIEDKEGNLLGVCGVGVVMTDIQQILQDYEEEYEIKVNLVNKDGLVQVDTDSVNIENSVLGDIVPHMKENEEYVYMKDKNGGYVVTKYVEDFGWYLVIQKDGSNMRHIFSDIILKNILTFVAILVFLLICVRFILNKEKKVLEKSASTDRLTGLANRNYLKYNTEEKDWLAMKQYQSLAVFDIDRFKSVNDSMGHLKGDEILKQVAKLAKEVVGENGQVVRWGGDEFLILLKADAKEGCRICEELRKRIESDTRVTISVGVCRLEDGLENSFYKADERLYQAKGRGRNRVVGDEKGKDQ